MLTREEFLVHIDYIRSDIKGVNQRLDDLNGRTRTTENKIAVLEERTADTPPSSRKQIAGFGTLGGLLSGAAYVIWEHFTK